MRKDVLEKVFNTSENMLDKNLQPEERTKMNYNFLPVQNIDTMRRKLDWKLFLEK